MRIHLRFDRNNLEHSVASLFVNGQRSGILIASPAEMLWLRYILEHGCKDLSPKGRTPIEFMASGLEPEATPSDLDKAIL